MIIAHSLGADAAIIAADILGSNEQIQAIALIEPTLLIPSGNGNYDSLQTQANSITMNGYPVILADSINDGFTINIDNAVVPGKNLGFDTYNHFQMAVSTRVFISIIGEIWK